MNINSTYLYTVQSYVLDNSLLRRNMATLFVAKGRPEIWWQAREPLHWNLEDCNR
jgi:hypothetical protein